MRVPPTTEFPRQQHDVDICIVGGGMSGLCAAVSAARHGARVVLVHDRPVLGGNASSEIRMWICGAHGKNVKETGVLEEVQLDNAATNPAGNWSLWDAALWGKVNAQPNLTPLLNCSCCHVESEAVAGDPSRRRIARISAWQTTTQTFHDIAAKVFIDCSGDSVLATSGAEVRWGRESREEFGEDIEPAEADGKTMGNSVLIQIRRVEEEVPFTPPPFAYQFNSPEDIPFRMNGVKAHNFWWIELGGLQNTIADAEQIQQELYRAAWGVWDYIKNRAPAKADAANWALEWLGSLPGKRENRRYVGGHVLTQNDVRAAGWDPTTPSQAPYFDDTIAYGGWSMDDHHPAGLLYPGKPTIFHPAPSPYGIPYRCLFSGNVDNLMMAGRNISVTHAALSSTRVMATCALIGQAAGTAAALAVAKRTSPAGVYPHHVSELQQKLMEDDVWLPGLTREVSGLSLLATSDAPQTLSGIDRPVDGADNAWAGVVGAGPSLTWREPMAVGAVRLVFDSNLNNDKRMPHTYPQRHDRSAVPASLVRRFRIETKRDGMWSTAYRDESNHQRLRVVPLNARAEAVRLVIEETWGGGDETRVFNFEALDHDPARLPAPPQRVAWSDIVARQDPADLAPPENGLEHTVTQVHGRTA